MPMSPTRTMIALKALAIQFRICIGPAIIDHDVYQHIDIT
jgi:hypothetical protein